MTPNRNRLVTKRDGRKEEFDSTKIMNAITKALDAAGEPYDLETITGIYKQVNMPDDWTVENIQTEVQETLMRTGHHKAAAAFIQYRAEHNESRFIRERLDYMDDYVRKNDNAATASETDPNANVSIKNIANLSGEVYKTKNRLIQRQRMKNKLNELFPEVARQYGKDLDNHIIYVHDEASTPVTCQYCMAVSLYPLMTDGVGKIDGVTPGPPNDLQSFSGQLVNLIFLLSSQCKGAVAVAEYLIALNYYVIKEYGSRWYDRLDAVTTTEICVEKRTVRNNIEKAFKQFLYGVNQPAGNRLYQSPFTNISYYDKTYFDSLFGEFRYPDGTKPEWKAVDTLQRMFMKYFNKLRTKQILTFPVETFAMVHDGNDIIDTDYKELCAEMYAEGHSFFTYISDSADSLASCCRLRNEVSENTFSPTSGLTGVMTGSCNVITLNMSRIVQDCAGYKVPKRGFDDAFAEALRASLKDILSRVYKYHIAYKTMLYDLEDKGMFMSSNGGYIRIAKLYSTVGLNGLNEAARFLGMALSPDDKGYVSFLQCVLGTIKDENRTHSVHDGRRPFVFNSEVVPAEGLGGKNYRWDKEDGYWVPDDENLYNSYFYDAHDDTDLLAKFRLHGSMTSEYTDGGSALHANLEEHLSKGQYLKLIDYAIRNGTNYFTFNIPNSKCDGCGFITKHPIDECPECHGTDITQYTRVIGYLRPVSSFGKDRRIEADRRHYESKEAADAEIR